MKNNMVSVIGFSRSGVMRMHVQGSGSTEDRQVAIRLPVGDARRRGNTPETLQEEDVDYLDQKNGSVDTKKWVVPYYLDMQWYFAEGQLCPIREQDTSEFTKIIMKLLHQQKRSLLSANKYISINHRYNRGQRGSTRGREGIVMFENKLLLDQGSIALCKGMQP
ncbi:hypothetical protein J6590_000754 [Homalodisca vitripennis]|nr:hypothetical protein J6590_000754 [Homalodisca vitripennis]